MAKKRIVIVCLVLVMIIGICQSASAYDIPDINFPSSTAPACNAPADLGATSVDITLSDEETYKVSSEIAAVSRPGHCGYSRNPKTINLPQTYTLGPDSKFYIKNMGRPYNDMDICTCIDSAQFRISMVKLCEDDVCQEITGDFFSQSANGEILIDQGFDDRRFNKVVLTFNGWTSTFINIRFNPYVDSDGDGYQPPDDCDDSNENIYPGAPEICDGVKNNCNAGENAIIDKGCDSDLDGYIDSNPNLDCKSGAKCINGSGAEYEGTCHGCLELDCNDNDPAINPGATELCLAGGEVDENCDGEVNEGCSQTSKEDCEFLDGVWTGTETDGRCCLNEGQYFSKWSPLVLSEDFSACWNGKPIKNLRIGDNEEGDNNKALHYNGSWYGCEAPAEYNSLITGGIEDDFQRGAVTGKCVNIGDKTLGWRYCSYNGIWKNVFGKESIEIKPDPDEISFECCPSDYCWNGAECIPARELPGADYFGSGADSDRKCANGKWEILGEKPDQYGITTGDCGEFQCYWDTGSEGICVNDGNYSMDYYCNKGEWTTRTALVALELRNIAGDSDYTLFCDSYSRALNDYQYFEGSARYVHEAIKYIIGKTDSIDCDINCPADECPCTNNFCVLNYNVGGNPKTIIGVSLNRPFDYPGYEFPSLFEESRVIKEGIGTSTHYNYCDAAIEQKNDNYLGCNYDRYAEGSDAAMWYNAKTDSMIYSPQKLVVGEKSFVTSVKYFLLDPISSIIDYIKAEEPTSDIEDVTTSKFERIFVTRIGSGDNFKLISGVVDEDSGILRIMYENMYTDVCSIVDEFAKKYFIEGKIKCGKKISDRGHLAYYVETDEDAVVGGNTGPGGLLSIGYWADLTGKIRLDPEIKFTENPDLINSVDAEQIANSDIDWSTASIGLPVRFSATIGTAETDNDFFWFFDKNNKEGYNLHKTDFESINNVQYDYKTPGKYSYSLKVINNKGEYEEVQKEIDVKGFSENEPCSSLCIENIAQCNGYNQCDEGLFCKPDQNSVSGASCQTPNCGDGYKGPEETDIDCGGICTKEGKRCDYGMRCSTGDDCIGDLCLNGVCTPATLSCTITQNCEETTGDNNTLSLFKLSGLTNAHASLYSEEGYSYSVCCNVRGDEIGHDCDETNGGDIALRLSSPTNAHVTGNKTDIRYPQTACISSTKSRIQCGVSANCGAGGIPIVSVSGLTNAHVASITSANNYNLMLCCGYYSIGGIECGNSVIEAGEGCDDGNTDDNDGCSHDCQLECGNGVVQGAEECDDDNRISGDGCSATCIDECGNGMIDGTEECDDGNNIDGDGCDESCAVEIPDYIDILEGYWSFDEGTGNIAVDYLGENDGDISGNPQWIDGFSGKALRFDGNQDRVITTLKTNQTATTPGLTIIAWARPANVNNHYRNTVNTNNGNEDWSIYQYGNGWGVLTGVGRWVTGETIDEDEWQHIAAVFDTRNGRIRFYKNGEEVVYEILTGQNYNDNSVGALVIGSSPGGANNFVGDIDEVQVYNGALTAEEVRNNYMFWTGIKKAIIKKAIING